MATFWTELKRRSVVKMAALYVVAGWLVMQVADVLISLLELPLWVGRLVILLLVLGFLPAVALAWLFEMTPEGIQRQSVVDSTRSVTTRTGNKINTLIVVLLIMAIGSVWFDFWVAGRHDVQPSSATLPSVDSEATPSDEQIGDERSGEFETIAVLPFVNMSADPENEFFADGLSEELLNLLTQVPELRVAARTSSFAFKGRNTSIAEIADVLKVDHVLEGSVRKAGDTVRITAQLIEVENGFHIWSSTYDRQLRDVFHIQEEIAASVVEALKLTVLSASSQAARSSPDAYALYLHGLGAARHFAPAELTEAAEYLERSLAIDPGYAPAWVEYSRVMTNQTRIRMVPEAIGFGEARRAARKAIDIDAGLAGAYKSLGFVAIYEFDFPAAAEHLQRARSLAPDDPDVLNSVAVLYQHLGRSDRAIEVYRKAIALDPLWAGPYLNLAWTYFNAEQAQNAEDTIRHAQGLGLHLVYAQYILGRVDLLKGDPGAALEDFSKEPDDLVRLEGMALAYYALGRIEDSDAALREIRTDFYEQDKYPGWAAFNLAMGYAFRRDNDRAFEWLQRAHQHNSSHLVQLASNGVLQNLKEDPRWDELARKVGLSDTQLADIEF